MGAWRDLSNALRVRITPFAKLSGRGLPFEVSLRTTADGMRTGCIIFPYSSDGRTRCGLYAGNWRA
jgi:hypothetical protein